MSSKRAAKIDGETVKRDILLSIVLHVAVIAATVVSAPFDLRPTRQYDEIIRVSLTALPASVTPAPVEPEPISVPRAMNEALPDIAIEAPETAKKAVLEPKPEKKDPPKPRERPQRLPTKTSGPATEQEGQAEVEAPGMGAGSPFQGATIDNASFSYPYWFTQAFNKIAGNWRNPVAYDGTLVCVVYFQVIRSGRVIETRVEAPSGFENFDKACLLAIERSAPFPPLPKDFRDEIIGITVPFKNR